MVPRAPRVGAMSGNLGRTPPPGSRTVLRKLKHRYSHDDPTNAAGVFGGPTRNQGSLIVCRSRFLRRDWNTSGCAIWPLGWRPRDARFQDNRIPSEPAVAAVDLSRPNRTPMVVNWPRFHARPGGRFRRMAGPR